MKLKWIGDREAGEGSSISEDDGNGCGRKVLVGVKLDAYSRELLTWALVKVARPGDLVIALNVLDAMKECAATVISLVKTFDSVLSVYEGFCNLKQVDLKLKVIRGSSPREILVQEAKAQGVATVIVGASRTHHRILSNASVAKYCSRKLPKCFSVYAVDSSKIVFRREATKECGRHHQVKSNQALGCSRRSLSDSTRIIMENCERCTKTSVSPASEVLEKENSLALVPVQRVVAKESKHGRSILRQVFFSDKHMEKSFLGKISLSNVVTRQYSWHPSAVVFPHQKQLCSDLNDGSTLNGEAGAIVNGEDGAIVPYGFHADDSLKNLPMDLLNFREKYSHKCILYNYEDLASATANFSPERFVGKGGSSRVFKGYLPFGKEAAVKILKPTEDVLKEFVQEIEVITTLQHKNIVSLSGFCGENSHLLLVYDFLSRGSLDENLNGDKRDGNGFGWQERHKVAVGVAEALDYLHNGCAEPVVHRDVKSSNILLSDDFQPKLSDFGLASWASCSAQVTCTDVAGTFGYLAPEYFMHGRVSDKIDVYAFGVVLLELLSGRKPIDNENPKGQESLVMWAAPILKNGKLSQLLDSSLSSVYDPCLIERMVLAANLCIRRAPKLRPQMNLILKLLIGDQHVLNWAKQQVSASEEADSLDGELFPVNIQSHLNLALLDFEDDSVSVSSTPRSVSIEEYLQGRWSRSSSFD